MITTLIWKGETMLSCHSIKGLVDAFKLALLDTTDLSAERVEEIAEEATFDLEVRGEYGFGRFFLKVTL